MLRHSHFLSAFLLFCALAPSRGQSVEIRKAVFSDHQLFWPDLAGRADPTGRPHPTRKAKPGVDASAKPAPVHIAVLPVRITDYRESIPCDSCHRLSANGMEFFLENYFKDRLHDRFPQHTVELVSPNQPLVETRLNLLAYLDSLQLPWDRWLADSGQEVVYRPRDRYTPAAARHRLDKLGGMLGATHLLLPAKVRIRVTPQASNTHQGGLEWTFVLALWNVADGRPEWALRYSERAIDMDLDKSLEGNLDKGLGAAWDRLPAELSALWVAEPR
jgi:hypothetical protein